MDLSTETNIRIPIMKLLIVDACASHIVDDKTYLFPRMAVFDLMYNEFILTTNGFEHQPTTYHYFQLLTPQTLVLAAGAIQYALFAHVSGKMPSVMFSQDE